MTPLHGSAWVQAGRADHGHTASCEGSLGTRYLPGSPCQINKTRGSPSPAWADTINKVSAALEQRFPAQSASSLPKQRQIISLLSWPESFCCAMNQHSKRFPHAEETLLLKFLSPHGERVTVPLLYALLFLRQGNFKFGMRWSTAAEPSQAADVTAIHPWGSGISGTDALQHVSVQEHGMEMRKHHGNRKGSRALTGRKT